MPISIVRTLHRHHFIAEDAYIYDRWKMMTVVSPTPYYQSDIRLTHTSYYSDFLGI